jgi:adenylyltransferase/sulfurtransferase
LGVLPGVIGTLQAIETIKLITGIGEPMLNRLLIFDALKMKFREFKLRKNPDCAVCSDHPTITSLIDYEQFCGMPAHDRTEASSATSTPSSAQSKRIDEITVHELKARLDRGEKLFILDVRNPNEYQICHLSGSVLIPLSELPHRLHEIPKDQEIVVHCKMGGRSAQAIEIMKQHGFTNLKNLVGGINAWATEIDKTMPTY